MRLCRTFANRLALASSSPLCTRKTSRSLTTLPERPNEPPSSAKVMVKSLRSTVGSSDPSSKTRAHPILRPYTLSTRIIALCKRGDVDLAVDMLKNAPMNAQNIKVWNTLIQQCMDAKQYNLAFRVFTDMKRRGFVPNIRTYATMMSGYATVEDWTLLPKQLGFAHSIYTQLKLHLKKSCNLTDVGQAQAVEKTDLSFALYVIAIYISILGKAGKYQELFDVFHALDNDGPLSPHPKIYSSILCVLADRADSAGAEQTVSDAKYIWRRHMRSLDKRPDHYIEPRSVDAVIKILSRGKPSDLQLMFDILHDICGFPRPLQASEDEHQLPLQPPQPSSTLTPTATPPPKVQLTPWILSEILDSCITAGRPDVAVHYAQSMKDRPELHAMLLPRHIKHLLRALRILVQEDSLTPPTARSENAAAWVEWMVAKRASNNKETSAAKVEAPPGLASSNRTVAYALELCYHCKDIISALRIAQLVLEDPDPMRRSGSSSSNNNNKTSLSTKAWTYLFRLAMVAGTTVERRRCIELLNKYGSVLDAWDSRSAFDRLTVVERRGHVSLASAVVQLLRDESDVADHDGEENKKKAAVDGEEEGAQPEAWSNLQRRAKSFFKMAR